MTAGLRAPIVNSFSDCVGIGFDGAGTETKQFVGHANAHESGRQHDDAQPSPGAQHASGGQDDQRQTSDDAKNAVDAAYVLSHDFSFIGDGSV